MEEPGRVSNAVVVRPDLDIWFKTDKRAMNCRPEHCRDAPSKNHFSALFFLKFFKLSFHDFQTVSLFDLVVLVHEEL